MNNKINIKLLANTSLILTLALLVAISTNLVHAVTAQKMIQVHAQDWMIGSYMAILSIGSFLSAPYWGKLSDKIGRKYVFIFGAIFYLIGSLGFCLDSDPIRIHFWRFISGLASAQNIITMVMLSDWVPKHMYRKVMILFSLAENIGFGIGRFIGGIIGNTNFNNAFYLQVALQILIIVTTLICYRENMNFKTNNVDNKQPSKNKEKVKLPKGLKNPLLVFGVVVFLSYMAKVGYNNMINIFATKELHLTPASTSIYMLMASIVIIVTLLIIAPILAKKINIHNKVFIDLFLGGIFLFVGAMLNTLFLKIMFSLAYEMFNVMFEAAINPYVISKVSEKHKGQYTGYITSFRFAGQMGGALSSGFTFAFNHNLPFIIAGSALIISALIYLTLSKDLLFKNRKSTYKN